MTPAAHARTVLAAALLIGVTGCVHFPKPAAWVKVMPVTPAAAREGLASDGHYAGAVAAISRRDYAAALDLLQAARARDPRDVRVLNAFGVVYDKLGRFDLSARYYAEGRALAPDSAILASNLAYSAALEQRAEAHADDAPAPAPVLALAPVIAAPRPLIGVPGAIRLAYVQQAQLPVLPLLTGRPLQIVNASGAAGAQQVVVRLASLGWSTPRAMARAPQLRARTEISYPARSERVARALANTLPAPGARLVNCAAECNAIRLTLGADALGWRSPRSATVRGD